MTATDSKVAVADFKKAVNMSAKRLAAWLKTTASKKVGFKATEGSESVGHDSGEKIVVLLGKTQADYNDADIAHAPKSSATSTVTWRSGQRVMLVKHRGAIRS